MLHPIDKSKTHTEIIVSCNSCANGTQLLRTTYLCHSAISHKHIRRFVHTIRIEGSQPHVVQSFAIVGPRGAKQHPETDHVGDTDEKEETSDETYCMCMYVIFSFKTETVKCIKMYNLYIISKKYYKIAIMIMH